MSEEPKISEVLKAFVLDPESGGGGDMTRPLPRLRSAAVILDTPRERTFRCEDCHKPLDQPVDKTGLYVLRGNEPLLICPECALPDDLYIWGDPALLDRQDWTLDMLKTEQDREQARIDAKLAQKAFEVEMEKMKDEERAAAIAAQEEMEDI